MIDLDGKKVEIKELLNREFFYRVPEYQRPFCWEEENFSDLIDDLLDAQKGKEYFIGTIVLHRKCDLGIHEIVDGQQRLTTLMILFACLRDLLDDDNFKESIQEKILQKANIVDGIPEKVRLEVKDREIFKELVIDKDGIHKIFKESLPEPQWRYICARDIFLDRLKKLSQDELKEFVQFISQKCIMIYLSTSTFDDAFKLFTIVNDRGKQLRRIDILKAKNISPDIVDSETVRNRIAHKWEEWEKELGEEEFENILHLIRFIKLAEKPYSDLLVEYEDKIFARNLMIRGESFVDEVCEYCKLYNNLFIDMSYMDNDEDRLKFIGLLWIMNQEFRASEWKACLMAYCQKFERKRLLEFLLHIEKAYLEHWVKAFRKDDRTMKYGKILKSINACIHSEPETIFAISELKADEASIIEASNDSKLFSKNYCKYLLLRLELLTSENDVEKKFQARTVEHVLPQNPSVESAWLKWFSDGQREEWINRLANLVLLSRRKNAASRNYDFEKKKERYLSKRVSDYPRSIQVLNYKEWTPEILEKRQKEAIAMLLKNP